MMKALTIRQPYAWSIIRSSKDIENRCWSTKYRGPLLIHAAKALTRTYYEEAAEWLPEIGVTIPPFAELKAQTGGIVGIVDLVDCVVESASPWRNDEAFGFVLANPRALPFIPMKGQLGLFNADLDLKELERAAHGIKQHRGPEKAVALGR